MAEQGATAKADSVRIFLKGKSMIAWRNLLKSFLGRAVSWRVVLLMLLCGCASSGTIKPFTTDGCSRFPDGTFEHKDLWLECCVNHDVAYWQGGTYGERKTADLLLRVCVDSVGEPEIADLMYHGVRAGGSPYWPTSYRWGYGWPWPRGYKVLTAEEKTEVEKKLAEASRVTSE